MRQNVGLSVSVHLFNCIKNKERPFHIVDNCEHLIQRGDIVTFTPDKGRPCPENTAYAYITFVEPLVNQEAVIGFRLCNEAGVMAMANTSWQSASTPNPVKTYANKEDYERAKELEKLIEENTSYNNKLSTPSMTKRRKEFEAELKQINERRPKL